jgi:hypothetical protein
MRQRNLIMPLVLVLVIAGSAGQPAASAPPLRRRAVLPALAA